MNSDPATSIDGAGTGGRGPAVAAWVVGLLQAGDAFYPTGGYAHSSGLEGLVQAGVVRDAPTLRAYLRLAVMPALRQTELPLAAHAWEALGADDWERVAEVCRLAAALKAPRELRAAAGAIGRQRIELTARLHGAGVATEFLRRAAAEEGWFSPAVAAAVEGRTLGAPRAAVLAGLAYGTLAGLVAAAMKLLRLGQNAAQALLTEALAETPSLVAAAEQVAMEEIGWFNPWLDIAAARHEAADHRMFIS